MKETIRWLLAESAKAILKKYKPKVIAITGSVGKTSTREAVFAVVASKYTTRTNIKNYNNEYGLPFTIIGVESPKKNIFNWILLFWKVVVMIMSHKPYPRALVLELGIDRPGDMDYLMEIVKPDVSILTGIGISHIEFFSSDNQIFNEKRKIFKHFTKQHGTAVINIDDPKLTTLLHDLKTHIITYGFNGAPNISVENYHTSTHKGSVGTKATISINGEREHVYLEGVLGKGHVYAIAAAAGVGLALHVKKDDILRSLKNYSPQPGRMRALKGIHNSIIIDDTYNAAPNSTEIALKELGDFPGPRKIAALGDMLELGSHSDRAHKDIANEILKYAIDYFVAVGPKMKIATEELKRSHFDTSHIFWFENPDQAKLKLKELVTANSIVLVKGSQGMRMEKATKTILAEPLQAAKLLCRQDPDWLLK